MTIRHLIHPNHLILFFHRQSNKIRHHGKNLIQIVDFPAVEGGVIPPTTPSWQVLKQSKLCIVDLDILLSNHQRLQEEEDRLYRESESIREIIATMYMRHIKTLDSERSKQVNESRLHEKEFFERLYDSEAIRSKSLIVKEFWRRVRVEESRRRRHIESRLAMRRQIEDWGRLVEEDIRIFQIKENDTLEAEERRRREKLENERKERELWDIESIMDEFDDMFDKSQEEEDSTTMKAVNLLGSVLALLWGLKWSFEFFFP